MMDRYGAFSSWGLGLLLSHGSLHKGGGGGGGDGGAAKRAEEEAARKAEARKAVNRIFGYGDVVPASRREIYKDVPVESDPVMDARRLRNMRMDEGGDDMPEPTTQRVVAGYEDVAGDDPTAAKRAREQQIQGIAAANLDLNKTALNEQKEEAARRLKFALSRQGLRGGSADVYESGRVQRTYNDQLRRATAGADEIASNLRTADEEARLRLLGQVEAGADQSSLLAGAGETLQANIDRANSAAKGNIITGAFEDIGTNVASARDARERQAARERVRTMFGGGAGSTYQGATTRY